MKLYRVLQIARRNNASLIVEAVKFLQDSKADRFAELHETVKEFEKQLDTDHVTAKTDIQILVRFHNLWVDFCYDNKIDSEALWRHY